ADLDGHAVDHDPVGGQRPQQRAGGGVGEGVEAVLAQHHLRGGGHGLEVDAGPVGRDVGRAGGSGRLGHAGRAGRAPQAVGRERLNEVGGVGDFGVVAVVVVGGVDD